MRTPTKLIVGILFVLCVAPLSLQALDCSFLNDFIPYQRDSLWVGGEYRDILVNEDNTITLFWNEEIDKEGVNPNRQVFFSRLDCYGNVIMPPMLVTDSAQYSIWSSFDVGHNRSGKWVLASRMVRSCPGDPYCYRAAVAIISNDDGTVVDTMIEIGNQIQPSSRNYWPQAAVDSAGNFVVVWVHEYDDASNVLFAQLFWSDGSARSDTIRLGDGSTIYPGVTYADAEDPRIDMMPNGDFVVAYYGYCDKCPPWNAVQTFYRLVAADGTPKTPELCATCSPDTAQYWDYGGRHPDVAIEADGEFAISCTQFCGGCGCYAVEKLFLFNADGSHKGPQIILDSLLCAPGFGLVTDVASDSAGNVIVAWQDDKPGGGTVNLKAKRFNALGDSVGVAIKINDSNKLVLPGPSTPVDINENGLVGFYWADYLGRINWVDHWQHFIQLMVLQDIGAYICGDANNDRWVNISDAVYLINYVFAGGQAPAANCLGDANGDDLVNISDAVTLITYIFNGGNISGQCP